MLEAVRTLVRESIPHLEEDRYLHPEIAAATEMIRSGEVAAIAAGMLPGISF
jgi:histidine ammonia-lyase